MAAAPPRRDAASIAFPGERADVRATIRETDRRVGFKLREARQAAGVTQRRLSEALGVSVSQVAFYEKGEDRLSAATLAAAAAFVGRDVGWFVGEPRHG